MPISTIRANAHRSYVSVSAVGWRGRRIASDESLFMRRISRVVEAPLDDVIALFDEFRVEDASTVPCRAVKPAPQQETEPNREALPIREESSPDGARVAASEAASVAPTEAPAARDAASGSVGEEAASSRETPVLPMSAAAPPEGRNGPVEERVAAAPGAAVAAPTETQASADRVAAMRAARRRMRSRTATQVREPRAEETPIFLGAAWRAEPDGFDEPASFAARAEAALSLPEEPLLARIAYEQNRAIFLDGTEEEPQAVQEAAPHPAEPPTEADVAEASEPPVREMVEEELAAESHVSATGATVNVYRMYDAEPTAAPRPASGRDTGETTVEVEAEPYIREAAAAPWDAAFDGEPATAAAEAGPRDETPTIEAEAEICDDEPTLDILEPEIEVEAAPSLPACAKTWPWEASGDLSLEEALETLTDKELSGLTTEIVTNTVEGALEEGAIKSLCRRYSLRLQAVYNAILRESKRRISRMTEKRPAPSGGADDATRELGMRMAKKLLAAEMHHKRTWFQSPFPEADGRYYIIQSHRVEDETLPTEFPTERVHYEELGDGWAISVGY